MWSLFGLLVGFLAFASCGLYNIRLLTVSGCVAAIRAFGVLGLACLWVASGSLFWLGVRLVGVSPLVGWLARDLVLLLVFLFGRSVGV